MEAKKDRTYLIAAHGPTSAIIDWDKQLLVSTSIDETGASQVIFRARSFTGQGFGFLVTYDIGTYVINGTRDRSSCHVAYVIVL